VRTALEKKRNRCKELSYRQGFSLVELLVAMAITGVVMAAVYKIYTTQQDSYVLQEQVVEMQQNGRTAKYVMTREIRMAGYDPTGLAKAGFITAGRDIIHFTMDITGGESDGIDNDGDLAIDEADEDYDGAIFPGDDITYSVSAGSLFRNDGSGNQSVVENIDAIGFAYAYANEDGDIEKDGDNIVWAIDSDPTDTTNQLDEKLDGTVLDPFVDLDRIRAVKIWLLVKTGNPDRNYTSANTYVVGNRTIDRNDRNRRQLLATTVKCRNMAL
jgi:type IV pilus assembly protein PilW